MRLIDADALIKDITESVIEVSGDSGLAEEAVKCYQAVILKYIDTINTINPEDCRTQGKWVDRPTGAYGRWQSWCSVCGKHSGIGGIESNRHKTYCPNCGAKMDGKEQNNA